MPKFIYMAINEREKEAQKKALSSALVSSKARQKDLPCIEGIFLSPETSSPEDFLKKIDSDSNLLIVSAALLPNLVYLGGKEPLLREVPILAVSVRRGTSLESMIQGDFLLNFGTGPTNSGYDYFSKHFADAGIKLSGDYGLDTDDLSKALGNVIGCVERDAPPSKSPKKGFARIKQVASELFAFVGQRKPLTNRERIWLPVIVALTEAHKAGTPVTWDALVAHDDTHVIMPRVKAPSVPKSSASPAPTR